MIVFYILYYWRFFMSLINCPECNNLISDKSKVCIKCGFPLDEYIEEIKIKSDSEKDEENEKKKYWCRHCYRQNKIGEDYCAFCGERLTPYYKREQLEINSEKKEINIQKRKCPKCGGYRYHAFVDEEIIVPAKIKSKTTLNLNPLKPFIVFNHKEKVVRQQVTRQVSKFVCDDCGCIFE